MTIFGFGAILLMICLLIGYAVGRRVGFRSGLAEGRALNRIELREQSLRQGACPICDRS